MKAMRFSLVCLSVALVLVRSGWAEGEKVDPPEAAERTKEAKDFFEKGDYRGAEMVLAKLAAKYPGDVKILSNLGVVRFRAGKHKQAEEVLRQAIAIEPENAFALSTLGIVLYTQQKNEEAAKVLKKAVDRDPNNATAADYYNVVVPAKAGRALNQRPAAQPLPTGDFLTPLERSRLKLPDAAIK